MNIELTYDKMEEAELVARILGKKEVDEECYVYAAQLVKEEPMTLIDAESYAIRNGRATLDRFSKIQAAVELGRRAMINDQLSRKIEVTRPDQVAALMSPIYKGKEHESFHCLCLDTKNKLKKLVEVSVGSLNASIVNPREVFKEAVRMSAAAIVVTHNHPSGDPTPSGADIQITRRIVNAGDVLGIDMLDHIVFGGGGRCISMRDERLI